MKPLAAQHADLRAAIEKEAVRGRTNRLRKLQDDLRRLTNKILARQLRRRLKHQER